MSPAVGSVRALFSFKSPLEANSLVLPTIMPPIMTNIQRSLCINPAKVADSHVSKKC